VLAGPSGSDAPSGGRPDLPDPGWIILGRVIGGITGIAAIIYFVGAATMWLRLDLHGFNPEIGLAHMPNMQLAILGLRGLVLVAAVAAIPLILALLLLWEHRRKPDRLVRRSQDMHQAIVGIASFLLFVVGLDSWTWFGISLAAIASLLALAWFEKTLVTEASPRWGILTVCFGLAAAMAAVCIQLGAGRFQISGVRLDPAPNAESKNLSLPYFGQADGYIYVPHVTSSGTAPNGSRTFHDNGEIIAVATAGRSIRFPPDSDYMRYQARSPKDRAIALVRDTGSSIWDYVTAPWRVP
jgi:hypothetical protein